VTTPPLRCTEPFAIVDVATPVRPHPSITELLRTRLIEGAVYATYGKERYTGL
jgi:hypothetical protein